MKQFGHNNRTIFIIIFLLANKSYCQYDLFSPKYALLRWEADSLYKKGEFRKAGKLFEKAGKLNSAPIFKWVSFYNASKCYSINKNVRKSFSMYKKASRYGLRYASSILFQKDSINFPFIKFNKWKKISKRIEKTILKFSHIDNELKYRLTSLYEKDQKYRILSNNLKTKGTYFRDSLTIIYGKNFSDSLISSRMREQDVLNQIEFKSILKKYGWPGLKLV